MMGTRLDTGIPRGCAASAMRAAMREFRFEAGWMYIHLAVAVGKSEPGRGVHGGTGSAVGRARKFM